QLLVSRRGDVTVADVGSANGTLVDGVPVSEPAPLTTDNVLEIGNDRLQWVPLPSARLWTSRSTDGHLDFDREFAPAPAIPRTEATRPTKDPAPRNIRGRLVSGLAPLAAGGVLAAVMRQPAMLLFGLFGLVTAFGAYVAERYQRKAREREYADGKSNAMQRIN